MPLIKVYHVEGIRHCAVIFASSPEEAVAQAVERGLVGNWEAPYAVEAPLPPGYYLAYDPFLAARRPELPLSLAALEPDKPHKITSSGVKVYDDWHDNIVVDADAPPLAWKAIRASFVADLVDGQTRRDLGEHVQGVVDRPVGQRRDQDALAFFGQEPDDVRQHQGLARPRWPLDQVHQVCCVRLGHGLGLALVQTGGGSRLLPTLVAGIVYGGSDVPQNQWQDA